MTPRRATSSLSPRARRRLLDWFQRHARPLPWRRDRDPYRIWISEVMLQQTTVAAVGKRFETFIEQFPNVQSLAAADEQHVLKAWEGMGYYRRARHLHAAARLIAERHGGAIPNDVKAFEELPGVGRYMVGAVLSQAFDRRLPIVEANSKRVLCRLFAQKADPESAQAKKWLWEKAEAILPNRRVGDFNQALMELGALICTPRNPNCRQCPLRPECEASQHRLQEEIPVRRSRPETTEVREVCVVFRHGRRVLLARRPSSGRWSNMWEFPRVVLNGSESIAVGLRRLIAGSGVNVKRSRMLTTIRYSVTRFRMKMKCVEAFVSDRTFQCEYYEEGRWVRPNELSEYPISTPQRKLASAFQSPQPR